MKDQEYQQKLNKDKNLFCYSINDFYKPYKDDRKGHRTLTQKQYSRITRRIWELIGETIIETTKPFNSRIRLGRFGIIKKKSYRKKIDFYLTKKHKKKIYYDNKHTDGCHFEWVWERSTHRCNVKNKNFYKFNPVPKMKNKLHEHIMKLDRDPYSKPYDCLSMLPPYD